MPENDDELEFLDEVQRAAIGEYFDQWLFMMRTSGYLRAYISIEEGASIGPEILTLSITWGADPIHIFIPQSRECHAGWHRGIEIFLELEGLRPPVIEQIPLVHRIVIGETQWN